MLRLALQQKRGPLVFSLPPNVTSSVVAAVAAAAVVP